MTTKLHEDTRIITENRGYLLRIELILSMHNPLINPSVALEVDERKFRFLHLGPIWRSFRQHNIVAVYGTPHLSFTENGWCILALELDIR